MRPAADARPGVVVVLHGGFWRAPYTAELGLPLARDLAGRGWTAWNLEYRRVGACGGYEATLSDVARGVDALARIDVDSSRLVVVGHSAGGQLAAWAAGRHRLPDGAPGARPVVAVTGVVALAGVLQLERGAREGVGGTAVPDFVGGRPDQMPGRYRVADPTALLPLGVPVRCVHARGDDRVPFETSARFVDAAVAAGDDARLVEAAGDHFTLIDPAGPDWALAVDAVEDLIG